MSTGADFKGDGTLSGRFTFGGQLNLHEIERQLRVLTDAVRRDPSSVAPARRRRGTGDTPESSRSRDGGNDAPLASTTSAVPPELRITRLRTLKGSEVGVDDNTKNDVENILTRPAFTLYSFDPSKDLHTAQQTARNDLMSKGGAGDSGASTAIVSSGGGNGNGKHKRQSKKKQKSMSFVERMLQSGSDVSDSGCFESLVQTMWWYSISIGRHSRETSSILPYIATSPDEKLARIASNRTVVEQQPAYLATALRIAKTARNAQRAWGACMARVVNNPGVPCHTDDADRRNAVHRLYPVMEYLYKDVRDANRKTAAVARMRAAAALWEGNAPTIAEQRALLCLWYDDSRRRDKDEETEHMLSVRRTATERAPQINLATQQYVSADDDDSADDYVALYKDAMWFARCIVYAANRGNTPGMHFGTESCRWYRSSDEHNALAASDLSPTLTMQPRSVSITVGRTFLGKREVRQRRIATARVAVPHENILSVGEGYFNRLRDVWKDAKRRGIVVDARATLSSPFAINDALVEGAPALMPTRFNVTHFASAPITRDTIDPYISYGDAVQESMNARDEQSNWTSYNQNRFGVKSVATMANTSSLPHPRVFDDNITWRKDHSSPYTRNSSFNATERTRTYGEILHQCARDISELEFLTGTRARMRRLLSVDRRKPETAACPPSPMSLDHVDDVDELVRISHELFCKRALTQDFDDQMLAHEIEGDAAARVRPLPHSAPDMARAMIPCRVRRSLYFHHTWTIEDVRAVYWSLLDKVYAHFHRKALLNEKPGKFHLSKLTDYKAIEWQIRTMSASAVSAWIREWYALEDVDYATYNSVFHVHVAPCLVKYRIAPKLDKRAALRRLAATSEWDGDLYSPSFTDDDYIWHPIPFDRSQPKSRHTPDLLETYVRSARACIQKRAEEQNLESLFERYSASTRMTRAFTALPHRDAEFRKHVAAMLLLSTGVFDSHASGALARHYFVDILNEAFVARFSPDRELYNAQPEYGRLARMLSDQFSWERKQDVQRHLQQQRSLDVVSALSRAMHVSYDRTPTRSNTTIQSVLNNIGVVSLLASPYPSMYATSDSADAAQFASRFFNTVVQSEVTDVPDFYVREKRAGFVSHAVHAELAAAYYSEAHSFVGNTLSVGDTRSQLHAYHTSGGFMVDFIASGVPKHLQHVLHEASLECRHRSQVLQNCDRDATLWHGYAASKRRRDREVERANINAVAMKYGSYAYTSWGADRFHDQDSDFHKRLNSPVMKRFDRNSTTDEYTHRFEIAQLPSYFYKPAMNDTRFARGVFVREQTYVNAFNRRTLSHYRNTSELPIERVRHADTGVVLDLLAPAKMAYDRVPQVFSRLTGDERAMHGTRVNVDGSTAIGVMDLSRPVPTHAASCKPYPLRVPACDYFAVDVVARASSRYCARYVLERETLPEHFAAFLSIFDRDAYAARIDGADSSADKQSLAVLNRILQSAVHSRRSADRLVPHEHSYDYRFTDSTIVPLLAVHSHLNFKL